MSKRTLYGFQRKQVISQHSQDFSGYQKTRDAFMGGAVPSVFNEVDQIEDIIKVGKNLRARDIRYRGVR